MSLFQSQKAMRAKRQAAMNRGVVSILDIGTSKIVCMVLQFDPNAQISPEHGVGAIANHGSFRVIGVAKTRSRGVKFGEIHAMEETERAIRTAVQGAQKMANIRVDHVIACFSGARPRSYGLDGTVMVEGAQVAESDIGRALASCDYPDLGPAREPIHAMPVNFTLDMRSGLADPRGQTGHKLSVDLHLLSVDEHVIQNVLTCVKRCDLELAGIASASYASGMSALVEDEQELGGACIDMGGGATSVSIFLRKHMIFSDSVRVGGEHITSDISHALRIPKDLSERIKTLHGGVIATGADDREIIDLTSDTGDWEHDRRRVTRSELIGVIRPRVEEILELVREKLDAAGFDHARGGRIVLTGGASQLPGMEGLASRILGQQVRLGRPLRVYGLPQAATGPDFAAAVGLALYAAYPQDECWDFHLPSSRIGGSSMRRAVQWFRENW